MNRLKFYYEQSLLGYFIKRAKEKWFSAPAPSQLEINGVILRLEGLPLEMRKILMSGSYEAGEMNILSSLISQNDQVLEIGSAIGFLGLYCQKVIKVKKYVGCEPNPVTLGYLRQNYALNNITPNIIEAAIAASDGPVTFNTGEMFWADSLLPHAGNGVRKAISVEGLSLNSLLQRSGPGFNALVIDVEGAEEFIAFDSLPASVNKILIEIHPQFIGFRKAYAILESLIGAGFKFHGHHDSCWGLIRD